MGYGARFGPGYAGTFIVGWEGRLMCESIWWDEFEFEMEDFNFLNTSVIASLILLLMSTCLFGDEVVVLVVGEWGWGR